MNYSNNFSNEDLRSGLLDLFNSNLNSWENVVQEAALATPDQIPELDLITLAIAIHQGQKIDLSPHLYEVLTNKFIIPITKLEIDEDLISCSYLLSILMRSEQSNLLEGWVIKIFKEINEIVRKLLCGIRSTVLNDGVYMGGGIDLLADVPLFCAYSNIDLVHKPNPGSIVGHAPNPRREIRENMQAEIIYSHGLGLEPPLAINSTNEREFRSQYLTPDRNRRTAEYPNKIASFDFWVDYSKELIYIAHPNRSEEKNGFRRIDFCLKSHNNWWAKGLKRLIGGKRGLYDLDKYKREILDNNHEPNQHIAELNKRFRNYRQGMPYFIKTDEYQYGLNPMLSYMLIDTPNWIP